MNQNLRSWAQLVRVPNTLTASADVLAGLSLTLGAWNRIPNCVLPIVLVSLGSICFYWAGMVLNDVNDVEVDKAQRRRGPLTDGRILVHHARMAGWGLLICGLILAVSARMFLPEALVDLSRAESSGYLNLTWLIVPTAMALAACVVAYDSKFKATRGGPWMMGLCRGLNMLLGVSLGAAVYWPEGWLWNCVASVVVGHLLFVVGITLAARREGFMQQASTRIAIAWMMSLIGVAFIATSSLWASGGSGSDGAGVRLEPPYLFPLLVSLLALPWLRRALFSITKPGIETLVPAIKQAILSIVFLDAAVALQYGGNVPGLIVCSFAIPTLALARIFRMT